MKRSFLETVTKITIVGTFTALIVLVIGFQDYFHEYEPHIHVNYYADLPAHRDTPAKRIPIIICYTDSSRVVYTDGGIVHLQDEISDHFLRATP